MNTRSRSDNKDQHDESATRSSGRDVAQPSDRGMLRMRRAAGNQRVLSMLHARCVQPKLTVSQPDDSYEQEADRVADQVMRMPDAAISRQPLGVSKQGGMIQTKPG